MSGSAETHKLNSELCHTVSIAMAAQSFDSNVKEFTNGSTDRPSSFVDSLLAGKQNSLTEGPSVVQEDCKELTSGTSAEMSFDIASKQRQGTATSGTHPKGRQPMNQAIKGIRPSASVKKSASSRKTCGNSMLQESCATEVHRGHLNSMSSVSESACPHSDLTCDGDAAPAEGDTEASGNLNGYCMSI